jgi:pilus assembly protein CpaD
MIATPHAAMHGQAKTTEHKMSDSALMPRIAGRNAAAQRRTSAALAAVLLAVAGLSGGCASYSRDHVIVGSVPDDYRTRHPIIVSQSQIHEDIVVSASARELSYRDRGVVEDFTSRFRRSGAEGIAIIIPAGAANEAAARRVAWAAAKVMQEKGVPSHRIHIEHYPAGGHGDAAVLRLAYTDIQARLDSKCGVWDEDLTEMSENRNYSNFGCSTQQNLAAMIANPADLLAPRGTSEIDATRRTTVIEDWRENGTGDLPALFD